MGVEDEVSKLGWKVYDLFRTGRNHHHGGMGGVKHDQYRYLPLQAVSITIQKEVESGKVCVHHPSFIFL